MTKKQFEEIMNSINEVKASVSAIDQRVSKLESKNTKAKAKSNPKSAPKTEDKPKYKTRREAIEATYSEAERKAWGEAKGAEREIQKKAYEMTNAAFTEKVAYSVWRAQYNANLKALKASVR